MKRLTKICSFRLALGQDQLLRDFRFLENTEGVIVHLSEPPQVFSLLKNPRSSDHCLLLVATTTGSFQYKIFQLQVNQSKNVCVAANLWIQGEIEDENFKYSNAFIAGGTFLFDLIRRAGESVQPIIFPTWCLIITI